MWQVEFHSHEAGGVAEKKKGGNDPWARNGLGLLGLDSNKSLSWPDTKFLRQEGWI